MSSRADNNFTFPMHMGNKLVVAWASLMTTWEFWYSGPGINYNTCTCIMSPLIEKCKQVGLAVDDIKSVQEKAALKKEALQVILHTRF